MNDEPLRATLPDEKLRFTCPSWCKGHYVNKSQDDLAVLCLIKQYRLEIPHQNDAGLEFLYSICDNVIRGKLAPKQITALLTAVFPTMEQPYPDVEHT